MIARDRKEKQAADTRQALIETARTMFVEKGYHEATNDEIAAEAGVTIGAVYHHFGNKQGLFQAVFEEVESSFIKRLASETELGGDAWDIFCRGCERFLIASLDPAFQRIVLLDGPVVLGWQQWRTLDAKYGYALLLEALKHASAAGLIVNRPVGVLANLITGALNEAALGIAHSPNPASASREAAETVHEFLSGLRTRGRVAESKTGRSARRSNR